MAVNVSFSNYTEAFGLIPPGVSLWARSHFRREPSDKRDLMALHRLKLCPLVDTKTYSKPFSGFISGAHHWTKLMRQTACKGLAQCIDVSCSAFTIKLTGYLHALLPKGERDRECGPPFIFFYPRPSSITWEICENPCF